MPNSAWTQIISCKKLNPCSEIFEGKIEEENDAHPDTEILETNSNRIRVIDTDQGKHTQQRIAELKALVEAYRSGLIKENSLEE